MNINTSAFGLRMNNYYQRQRLVNTILNMKTCKKSVKMDTYYKSSLLDCITAGKRITSKSISSSILDALNFEYKTLRESNNVISLCGVEFIRSQIPSVSISRCSEIKAENNVISFKNGKYYKFTDFNGETHAMACAYDRVKCPYSETLRGTHDDKSYEQGKFWNMLSRNGTYMSLYYSDDEQRKYLNDAGITEGIFTVQVGNKKQEYLYSNGNCGVAVPKFRYDADYDVIKNKGRFFKDYEVGSIFKIDGKEYTLSENRTLDIPYGADIYNMERPAKKSS